MAAKWGLSGDNGSRCGVDGPVGGFVVLCGKQPGWGEGARGRGGETQCLPMPLAGRPRGRLQ